MKTTNRRWTLLLAAVLGLTLTAAAGLAQDQKQQSQPPIGQEPKPVCGDGTCSSTEDPLDCPEDCPPVCGDGICSPDEVGICTSDCDPDGLCGNGVCEISEDDMACPADCPAGCGDAICDDMTEDCDVCPTDCCVDPPDPVCGNGVCEAGEDTASCPGDCGTPGGGPPPPPPDPVCGDGVCGFGESPCDCPGDCGPVGDPAACACGDGVCAAGEDCVTCAADCGGCVPDPTGTCGDGVCEELENENCANCAADCGVCPSFPMETVEPPSDPAEQFDGLDPAFLEHWSMDLSAEEYAVAIEGNPAFEVATPLAGGDGKRDVVYRVAGSTLGTTLNTPGTWNLWAGGVSAPNGMTVVCWNRLRGNDSDATAGTMPDPREGVDVLCAVDSGQGFSPEVVVEAGQPGAWIVSMGTDVEGRPTVTYMLDSFGTLINSGQPGDDLVTATFE